MSTVWHETAGEGWRVLLIAEGQSLRGEDLDAAGVEFFRFAAGGERGVALLAKSGTAVLVNGQPLPGGFRLLEHRDEVLAGTKRLYFSAEATPTVVAFRVVAGARPCSCPVCRGVIKDGDAAVQCPGCGRWFHQVEPADGKPGRRCWTFAATCRSCQHPTSLSGEPVWQPEKEDAHV